MTPTITHLTRELDGRTTDGIEVRLLWSEHDGRVLVAVSDSKTGDAFSIEVRDGDRAMDVFHHPYAYRASREIALVAWVSTASAQDEAAFHRLVEPHRRELHAHCYRMTGSVHDAEDALQDALLRAWRALPRFEGRSSPRSWLYRIATNTCLDLIARRPKRVLPIDHAPAGDPHANVTPPLAESVWVEPYPDERLGLEDGYAAPEARYDRRESVELAFVAALQHLPPNQRAVLIMREVLGFSAKEVGDALDTTTASVNSAMQRARATVEDKLPERSQQQTLRTLGDEKVRELVERYVDAWDR